MGMTDRAVLVRVDRPEYTTWRLIEKHPLSFSTHKFLLRMQLNPDTAFRIMDKGPPGNEEVKVKEFKEFWGELAETRRFKDGSIIAAIGTTLLALVGVCVL